MPALVKQNFWLTSAVMVTTLILSNIGLSSNMNKQHFALFEMFECWCYCEILLGKDILCCNFSCILPSGNNQPFCIKQQSCINLWESQRKQPTHFGTISGPSGVVCFTSMYCHWLPIACRPTVKNLLWVTKCMKELENLFVGFLFFTSFLSSPNQDL